jgi:ethanolamine utilization protein EutL
MTLLAAIVPTILSMRQLSRVDAAVLAAYGGDPTRHTSLGLVTCDQDDALYVALDEATKHAAVDVVFAKSFYAGSAHASGKLSGEILGVIAAADPQSIADGLAAITTCLEHDACFYDADGQRGVTVFPHVIGSLGHYLSAVSGLPAGESMAYLVAPPMEATIGFDAALKAAAVRAVRITTPPTETNFACAWLTGERSGDLAACIAAAAAFAEAVVNVVAQPRIR